MCGRFVLTRPQIYGDTPTNWRELHDLLAGYNISPSQNVFVLLPAASAKPIPAKARWGMINPNHGTLVINARCETVAEKPMFRDSFKNRRCLVPANGWYEWSASSSRKQPYFISPSTGGTILMAAIYQPGPDGVPNIALLTTSSSADIAFIHDRMPVVITEQDHTRWLAADTSPKELITIMQGQQTCFDAWPVSRRVNKPENNDASLTQPVTPPKEEPGLFG